MFLKSYDVYGLRSLADVRDIPVQKPTILTGANDGGKSTALKALEFLLTKDAKIQEEDRTLLTHEEQEESEDGSERRQTGVVTGVFELTGDEQQQFQLPEKVWIRRSLQDDGSSARELLATVPRPADLRNLDAVPLSELQARAERWNLAPVGRRNAKESWQVPLRELAEEELNRGDCVEEWSPLPKDLGDKLPAFLSFSSSSEQEPEEQIERALRAAFKQLFDRGDERFGPVRELEAKLESDLKEEAEELRQLIEKRCPELGPVAVSPDVNFQEGLSGVDVHRVAASGQHVGLRRSGAGSRRQVNLAVWEWTRKLLDAREPDAPGVVIAYDEPDTHLDYGHQRDLMDLIMAQCDRPDVRMVVATHSLNLIDRVDVENIVHLRRDENEHTVVERLLTTEHDGVNNYLAQLSTSMGLRNSVLLHERCFVGVEGPTEMRCLPVLFRLATGQLLQSAGIALISGDGNTGVRKLAEHLRDSGRPVAFIVDEDSSRHSEKKKVFDPAKLKGQGFADDQIHFVGSEELEDCFTDEQWATTANKHWPKSSGDSWIAADIESCRSSGKFSKNLHAKVRQATDEDVPKKRELLPDLVLSLTGPDDVPVELRSIFESLRKLAA